MRPKVPRSVARSPLMIASVALLLPALTSLGACVPKEDPQPEWMKLPKAYQPAKADLTFNKERLDTFNNLPSDEQDKFVEELKTQTGAFKGQAVVKSGTGLSQNVEEAKHGEWELQCSTDREILFEITIDYVVYTSKDVGRPIAGGRPIKFSGTLLSLDFQDQNKPRSLTIHVKADSVETISD